MLKPIEKRNLPKEIIKQIVSEVTSGRLKPGDRLPPERELGGMFNVGRSSIREGLKVLEAVGLVKRTTEGTVLREPGEIEDPSILFGGGYAEIHEVFETRKIMEIELAGLAAQRATPEDVERIKGAIIKSQDPKAVGAADMTFHRSIVEAAKNRVCSQVYNMVTGLLFRTHAYYTLVQDRVDQSLLEKAFRQHKKIAKAIETHDPKAAKQAMQQHLDKTERALMGRVEKDL